MFEQILLGIAIVLLIVVIGLLVFLLLGRKKREDEGPLKEDLVRLLEENRIKSMKDLIDSNKGQNAEIQQLKEGLIAMISAAQKSNQFELVNFLEATKAKLTEIETTFSKESIDLKQQNTISIKDLITQTTKDLMVLKEAVTNGMLEAQKTNQNDLFKFLEETKGKLNDLQTNFTKQTSIVKEENAESIKNLLSQTTRDLNELKSKILAEINETNAKNNQNVNEQNVKTQEQITTQIQVLKDQVKKSLEDGFEKNEKAMHEFIQKTALIEASTRQMDELRKEINKFNALLSNQKARGNFGEGVLRTILISIFGQPTVNPFYREQVNFTKEFGVQQIKDETGNKSDVIVDFLFNITTDHGVLPLSIDAKFPYTNYVPLLDENTSLELREEAKKKFKKDVKDRIKEVTKYIIEGKTAPYAIMFVPAEAVFIDIFKDFPEVVEEARNQKIIIASPSLIITIVQILQFILKDYHMRNNADQILNLIDAIGDEFRRFSNRWDDHKNRVLKMIDDVKGMDITSKKLIKEFGEAKQLTSNQISNEGVIQIDDMTTVIEDTEV